MRLVMMDVEDKTFESISGYVRTLHSNTQFEMEILSELADAMFDTDLMEDTYHLKPEQLKGVNVFTGENEVLMMTRHIAYVKDTLHTKVYEVPPLSTSDLLKYRLLIRREWIEHCLIGFWEASSSSPSCIPCCSVSISRIFKTPSC